MDNTLTETFLERLRNSTARLHQQLEELPVSLSIISPSVSKEEYLNYLILMHDVICDTEDSIFPLLAGIIPDIESRRKKQLIIDDLKALGYNNDASKKPLSGNSVHFSIPFAMGIMYVIEGSSLGGRVILKNVKSALDLDETSSAAYFSGYGTKTGSRWKEFLEILTHFEEEHECGKEITEGANFAFKAIASHFNNMPVE